VIAALMSVLPGEDEGEQLVGAGEELARELRAVAALADAGASGGSG
jgi:hypothetical protein